MAIKEELSQEVKEEGGGKDELDALDALEKEATEFNKVCPLHRLLNSITKITDFPGRRDRPHPQSL